MNYSIWRRYEGYTLLHVKRSAVSTSVQILASIHILRIEIDGIKSRKEKFNALVSTPPMHRGIFASIKHDKIFGNVTLLDFLYFNLSLIFSWLYLAEQKSLNRILGTCYSVKFLFKRSLSFLRVKASIDENRYCRFQP